MVTGLMPRIQFTILARDKEPNMPMFFQCIENMDYDPKCIDIYAHTNNNSDRTGEMLKDWCNDNRKRYGNMHLIEEDIPELRDKPGRKSEADWYADAGVRLVKLAEIRQKSLEHAYAQNSQYYFVCDVDNFFTPETIKYCVLQNKSIIAPMLAWNSGHPPTSFYLKCASNGYYEDHALYRPIWNMDIKGVFQVPLVHMCYMVRTDNLKRGLSYYTDGIQMEYVTFSKSARDNSIQQYVTNEVVGLVDPTDDYNLNVAICRNFKYNLPYDISI